MIYLDVSELPAPGPLEKVLALLDSTDQNEIICMTHRQHPCSLLPILNQRGYTSAAVEKNNLVYIYIWHSKNLEAPATVEKEIKEEMKNVR